MRNEDVEPILIDKIRMEDDGQGTQLRQQTSEETVERYAEDLHGGHTFPVVDLVPVGDGTYYIADGWHRILAHKRIDRGVVDAIILTVVDGQDPLDTAKRYALRANQKHGLALTRGDQNKKARAALMMEAFHDFSYRELEAEIGVSKTTIGRVRNDLVMEGVLPWRDTERAIPDHIPRAYSYERNLDDPFHKDYDLKEEVLRFVEQLDAVDRRDWVFIHADDGEGEHLITHRGLLEGQTVRFTLAGNRVIDGMPERYETVEEEGCRPQLTPEELDRLEANRAKREFFAARGRLMKHPDKRLREAVKTLAKYRETPRLWQDLETFIRFGGPEQEHPHLDF
jgi:hypothetical protein